MQPLEHVAIYGVGLIGGSIGMAIRKRGLARQVSGIGRDRRSLDHAVTLGAIDCGVLELSQAVSDADLVVVCTPVHRIPEHVSQVRALCSEHCLVTDAGSTKRWIVEQCEQESKGQGSFIGSHPLAGSDRTGVDASSADLFSDRVTVVTPTDNSNADMLSKLELFWESLGSRVHRMQPDEHDRVLAQTSHLPHVIASVLAGSTPAEALPLTASGWADTTRVAAGDVGLWIEILLQNRDQILEAMEGFESQLLAHRDALRSRNAEQLTQLLTTGKQRRDAVGN